MVFRVFEPAEPNVYDFSFSARARVSSILMDPTPIEWVDTSAGFVFLVTLRGGVA